MTTLRQNVSLLQVQNQQQKRTVESQETKQQSEQQTKQTKNDGRRDPK